MLSDSLLTATNPSTSCVSSNASIDSNTIFSSFRLQVLRKRRAASEKLIRGLEKEGFKAIMLTVDAAVPGNREIDKRAKGFTVRASAKRYESDC